MLRHIAVIDIGKTNAKLVLIDSATAQEIGTLSVANSALPAPPYPHHDLDRLWAFILKGLTAFHKTYGIDAISITTHGATAVLMAGDALAMPALDYEYDGPNAMRADYETVRPSFAETLSPPLPNGLNLGAQIFYLQRSNPEGFTRVTDILLYPQYWAFRLTGIKAAETTSLGVHTDLWRPQHADYSALVDSMKWRDLFPPIRPTRSVLGTITAEIAAATGLRQQTPVATGIHDSNASLLPYLLSSSGTLSVISSGTWTILMSPGASTEKLDAGRDCLANVDAFGRPVPTSRFMGGREFELLMGDSALETPTEADIAYVIENDIMVLPTFAGAVGPFPHNKGKWIHGPEDLTPARKLGAVSLYLALVADTGLGLAGCGEDIMLEGPLAHNDIFSRALAAVTGKRVRPSADATGTSFGATLLFENGSAKGMTLTPPVTPLSYDGLAAYAARWRDRVAKAFGD